MAEILDSISVLTWTDSWLQSQEGPRGFWLFVFKISFY